MAPCVSLVVLLSIVASSRAEVSLHRYVLYFGTYTVRGSRGFYAYSFDADTGHLWSLGFKAGTLKLIDIVPSGGKTPRFAIDPGGKIHARGQREFRQ